MVQGMTVLRLRCQNTTMECTRGHAVLCMCIWLKPVLWDVRDAVFSNISHEQTQ